MKAALDVCGREHLNKLCVVSNWINCSVPQINCLKQQLSIKTALINQVKSWLLPLPTLQPPKPATKTFFRHS